MTHVAADARLAVRAWRKAPLFTLVAVASMALGIGVTTAVFTLVDQVLLRTLPIREPHRIVQLVPKGSRYGSNVGDGSELSHPMYVDVRDNTSVFAGVFGRFGSAFHIGYQGLTERVNGELVTGTYFPVLGVTPAAGRLFGPDDDVRPGGHPIAVLSHAYWNTRFGSDPAVIGSTLVINGHPYTIVGVARAGFDGVELGRLTQLWVPITTKAQVTPTWNDLDNRRFNWVRVFARLAPGVTAAGATAAIQPFYTSRLEMEVQEAAFAAASPAARQRFLDGTLTAEPSPQGRSNFRQSLTGPLWILLAVATGVLLIACANVANLLLARGAGRQREMALRLALGASQRRLAQQLLAESLLLALVGGAAGLAVAAVGAPIVLSFFITPDNPQPVSPWPDLRVLAFTIGVSTLTGILFGLAPALQSTRPALAPTLQDQGGRVAGGGSPRLRRMLVASQVTVSLLLLLGAVLFLRTLDNLLAVNVGFQTERLLTASLDPSLNGYTPERTRQIAKTLVERLASTPGVVAAGLAQMRLLTGNQWSSGFTIEGYVPKADERTVALNNAVTPDFFEAMGIPVIAGRAFDHRDEIAAGAPDAAAGTGAAPPPFRVAIANESFVKHYYGDANPIGRRIGFGTDPGTPTPIEIVGVVRDSKYTDVRSETPRQLFFPLLEIQRPGGFTLYLRTDRDESTTFAAVRRVLHDLDPNLPVYAMRTVDMQVRMALSNERLVATMSAVFGVLATLLAVVGLYGVMAYTVARRTREIGVRMALGANPGRIAWMVSREALFIAAAGVVLGLPLAWFLGRYVESQLYGVKPNDPATFAGVVALLGTITLLAALVPTRRAVRIDPTKALRDD